MFELHLDNDEARWQLLGAKLHAIDPARFEQLCRVAGARRDDAALDRFEAELNRWALELGVRTEVV